jgi:outer membrane biogenesis lipoprotein LolB
MNNRRLQKTSLLALVFMLLTACSSGVLETVRKVTYPPDFNYISKQKLQSTMHQFGWYTALLDNSLRDTSTVNYEQRQNAISILNKMETLSHELGTQSLSSNHNIVSFNIDQFRQNIVNARTGLEMEPPNYYLAGSVTAYCTNCHASGDDAIPK